MRHRLPVRCRASRTWGRWHGSSTNCAGRSRARPGRWGASRASRPSSPEPSRRSIRWPCSRRCTRPAARSRWWRCARPRCWCRRSKPRCCGWRRSRGAARPKPRRRWKTHVSRCWNISRRCWPAGTCRPWRCFRNTAPCRRWRATTRCIRATCGPPSAACTSRHWTSSARRWPMARRRARCSMRACWRWSRAAMPRARPSCAAPAWGWPRRSKHRARAASGRSRRGSSTAWRTGWSSPMSTPSARARACCCNTRPWPRAMIACPTG